MSVNPNGPARTYGVLVYARKARGGRLAAELQRRLIAHQTQVQAARYAADAQARAHDAFDACVHKLHTRLSSRVALQADEVLRLRAQRDAMKEKYYDAMNGRENADRQALQLAEDCTAQRRLIAANDEQVKSLQGLQDKALAAQAQGVENAEEDEREEACAGRRMWATP